LDSRKEGWGSQTKKKKKGKGILSGKHWGKKTADSLTGEKSDETKTEVKSPGGQEGGEAQKKAQLDKGYRHEEGILSRGALLFWGGQRRIAIKETEKSPAKGAPGRRTFSITE